MKVAGREVLYMETSRHNPPTLTVSPGEIFQVETELCSGGWLKSEHDTWSPEKTTGTNPSSGSIYVEGAQPGEMLAVGILDIQLSEIGYTGFAPGMTPFPDWIREREWGIVTRTVKIKDGYVMWSGKIRIPVHPMIGLMGTAPAFGVPRNSENGPHGGNMDIQEVTVGSTVFLPVFVEGGLLHVGDVHAVQGDGEICCAGGIETTGLLTLRVRIEPKPREMAWPRIETDDSILTVGCARPAEDAFRIAVQEMVRWMVASHGFSETDAFLLLGQVLHARCTQFVDPLFTYVCRVKKEFLKS